MTVSPFYPQESYPPSLPEFLYICEDLYQLRDMVSLEMNILKTLNFDINIPTPYNFLRRYASVTGRRYALVILISGLIFLYPEWLTDFLVKDYLSDTGVGKVINFCGIPVRF